MSVVEYNIFKKKLLKKFRVSILFPSAHPQKV